VHDGHHGAVRLQWHLLRDRVEVRLRVRVEVRLRVRVS
jgi:hypothetical protein